MKLIAIRISPHSQVNGSPVCTNPTKSNRSRSYVRRHPACRWQQQSPWQQQHQQQWHVVTCSTLQEDSDVTYEWSWNQTRSSLPEIQSVFDLQHPLTFQLDIQDALELLDEAAASEQPPSQQWLQQLLSSLQLQSQHQAADMCQLLQHLSQLDYTPDQQWMTAMLTQLCCQVEQLSTQRLSALFWALSNLKHTPSQQHWQNLLQAVESKLQDFYGPDLAQLLCAAGSIYNSSNSNYDPEEGSQSTLSTGLEIPKGWCAVVAAEIEYQVCEFVGDLGAFDLARIASGMADLRIEPTSKLQDALLKAVYMRTRTIEEKGAVDFALAKLDGKGKRSMHYDPRWTHEELKWLPRRERDKRRIIKENWYRTQWGGYGGGKTG